MDENGVLDWFRERLFIDVGVRRDLITPTANFLDDLGLDSLDEMNLLFSIEDEFGIEIFFSPESEQPDYDHVRTVGDAIHYILERLNTSTAF